MSEQKWSERLEELYDALVGDGVPSNGYWRALKVWADDLQAAGNLSKLSNSSETGDRTEAQLRVRISNQDCMLSNLRARISELEARLGAAEKARDEARYDASCGESMCNEQHEALRVIAERLGIELHDTRGYGVHEEKRDEFVDKIQALLAERDSLKEQLAERESTQAQLSVTTERLEGAYRDAESLREQLRPLEAIRQRLESMNACAANQDCGHCRKLLAGALASLPPPVAPEPAEPPALTPEQELAGSTLGVLAGIAKQVSGAQAIGKISDYLPTSAEDERVVDKLMAKRAERLENAQQKPAAPAPDVERLRGLIDMWRRLTEYQEKTQYGLGIALCASQLEMLLPASQKEGS